MRIILYLTLAASLFVTACSGPKNVVYFKDNTQLDTTVTVQPLMDRTEIVIQPDDILAINVTSKSSTTGRGLGSAGSADPVEIYNRGGTPFSLVPIPGSGGGGTGSTGGYVVDKEGYVNYANIGRVKVGGLTIPQVKIALQDRLHDFIQDPIVEARILNYRVTVLGEVSHPGIILAPNHKISVIDAISAAGDILISGRRDNLMIIRETNGHREMARINLNSQQAFNSPYFYLQQNDIIYVEQAKVRRQETNAFLRIYLPAISAIVNTGLAVYGIVKLSDSK